LITLRRWQEEWHERGKIGVLFSRVRLEEKLIFEALAKRKIPFEKLDIRAMAFDLEKAQDFERILIRCISHREAFYGSRILESQGVKTVNSHQTIRLAGDKLLTSQALMDKGVPTLPVVMAFSPQAAMDALEKLGYPAVIKPLNGSWGRLIAKIDSPESARSILEHRSYMGDELGSVFYIQPYVEKPGRDIRVMVVGEEVIYAIYRYSSHWITNTARGAYTEPCPITSELEELSLRAAEAVGGGILALDIFETPEGLVVNEVNHTPEFHGAMKAVKVDIPKKIVDYFLQGG